MKKFIIVTVVAGLLTAQAPVAQAAKMNTADAARALANRNQKKNSSWFKKLAIGGAVAATTAAIAYGAYCAYCACTSDVTPVVEMFTNAAGEICYNINGIVHTVVDGALCEASNIVDGTCTTSAVYDIVSNASGDPVVTNTVTGNIYEIVASTAPSITESITNTVTSTPIPSITDTVTETVAETITDTVTETVAETITDTVTETVAETITDTVTETVAETPGFWSQVGSCIVNGSC